MGKIVGSEGFLPDNFKQGNIYRVQGSVIQVGDDYVQVDDGMPEEKAEPFGMVKVTQGFLENFQGRKGDGVCFLSEFIGFKNFSTVSGGSLRLAVFKASHCTLNDKSIQIVDVELAEKVVKLLPLKEAPIHTSKSGDQAGMQVNSSSSEDLEVKVLGEWTLEKKNPTTGELAFKFINVFKEDGVYEFHFVVPSENKPVVSNGKWTVSDGLINVEYRFGNLESNPLLRSKIIFKDAKSFVMTDKDGKESDDLYIHQQSARNVDSGPSGGTEAVKELKSEKDLPELTAEQFDRFELNMGILRNELERGKIYQVMGSIIQVGPDYIQIDDGNSESFKADPYGVVKVSSEFLENFPGMRGDPVRFLAEFVGYKNFSSVTGRSLRLAVFIASHSSSLSGGSIKVIDRDLAQKVITMIPDKVQDDKKMASEGNPQLKPEKALPELTYDQFNSCEMIVGLKGQNLEKDKLYQVAGSITRLGSDFIKIVDGNSDWDEAEPYASVKVTREFLENFPGEGGDKVRFLAEFTGYSDSPNASGNNIRLANFKASYYSSWDGGQIEVIDKDLAKRAIAILQPPTATNQKKAEESKDKSKTAGVGEPMQTGPSKSAEADSTEADSVKIKIAELKGELAVIDSKIDMERKRWKEASDLINAITNNGTQPVIRNSPEHVRMYESQVIMKDVEAKAPELKEQKVRLEAALKALE